MMDRPAQDRGPRVNERIRVREVRLIDANGDQLGVVATDAAMARAKEQGLDLVEVAEKSRPPVCKIMDYGKFKYEAKRKKRQNAKKQHKVILKEVRMRPKTGEHDFLVKVKHARGFLEKGCKVQVNVLFRGRERAHTDIARNHLDRMAKDLEEIGKVEVSPKMEGYRMIMVMAPSGKLPPKKRAEEPSRKGGKRKGKGKRNKSKRLDKTTSSAEESGDTTEDPSAESDALLDTHEDAADEATEA